MSRKPIHVYLVPLEAVTKLIYLAETKEEAQAFEDEYNRRGADSATGFFAFADVHGAIAKPARKRRRRKAVAR